VSYVFISYSRSNAPEAERLCAVLEAAGLGCWIAPRDISPGRPWPAAISEAIAGAAVVAICLSPEANASPEVAREVIAAVGAHRPVLPIRLRDVEPTGNLGYLLAGLQWADAFGADGAFAESSLPAAVRAAIEGDTAARLPRPPAAVRRSSRRHVPAVATSLVGRDEDCDRVVTLLRGHRLVTLTGSAGVGKTRLALAVASRSDDRFPDGTFFVDLSPLDRSDPVVDTVAVALGVAQPEGGAVLAAVTRDLREKDVLLILDNCEHVIDGAAQLAHALLHATGVTLMATSREPLRVDGEAVYRVPALDDSAALELFGERATAVSNQFRVTDENRSTIAGICRDVDRIPYAIELAAARVRAMPPVEIARRLSERFRLLAGADRIADPRRQTLRAMIDWSHDLLNDAEQRVFRRLAIFSGGWAFDAASAVCAADDVDRWEIADHLASLVDKSLVVYAGDSTDTRYRYLETTRAYALERLEASGERARAVRDHLAWCVLAADAGERDWTTTPPEQWRTTHLGELDNYRFALHAALEERTDVGAGVRLAASLRLAWKAAGRPMEGVAWCERALALAGDDGSLPIAKLLLALGRLLEYGQQVHRRYEAAARAAEICRNQHDEPGLIQALQDLAFASTESGDRAAADTSAREALLRARSLGDRRIVGHCLQTCSFTIDPSESERRKEFLEEAYGIATQLRDRRESAALLMWLAELEAELGNTVQARERGSAALRTFVELGDDEHAAFTHANLCAYALDAGDAEAAETALAEALRLSAGNVPLVDAISGQYAAEIALLRGDPERAAQLKGYSDACLEALDTVRGATEARSLRRLEKGLAEHLSPADCERLTEYGRTLDDPSFAVTATLPSPDYSKNDRTASART
jgi:predicted ATPase